MGTVHIEPATQLAIRLSNRQFGQLRAIQWSAKGTVKIDELASFNQLTLGSNKRRGFIKETDQKDGVTITQEGRRALRSFERADFMRQVASMHFSTFLDLEPAPANSATKRRKEPTVRDLQRRRRAA